MSGLHAALAAAQAKMRNPPLDGRNPHYRNEYSTLKAVLDEVRGPLNEQGLFLNQTMEGGLLKTVVWSAEGESEVLFSMPVPTGPDSQKTGSAITYARRYSLLSAFGLCGDKDDDGEAACAPAADPPVPEEGGFQVRCRTCGKAFDMPSKEVYMGFLAGPDSRCCARPDWKVER